MMNVPSFISWRISFSPQGNPNPNLSQAMAGSNKRSGEGPLTSRRPSIVAMGEDPADFSLHLALFFD